MEIHIASRKAFYCNVKVLLVFLVIYGHLIETRIDDSMILMWQYRLIYAVHMSLFALVSGMFLKTKETCIAQMKTALKYYVICQTIYIAVSFLAGNKQASFLVPYWHLWYLLSLSFWAVICGVTVGIKRSSARVMLIFVCVVIACICGSVDCIGRFLSLSRTICFLPYVLLGQMLPVDARFSDYKIESIMAGVVSLILLIIIMPILPIEFFWQATSYEATQVIFGEGFRMVSYIIAFGLSFLLLSLIPTKRLVFSKAGTDTLWVYLLHGPIVQVLRDIEMRLDYFIILAPITAGAVYFMLYELCRWKNKWCKIT